MTTIEQVKMKARTRRERIAELRARGLTYQEIADKFNLSRQRVHAILNGRADQRGEK